MQFTLETYDEISGFEDAERYLRQNYFGETASQVVVSKLNQMRGIYSGQIKTTITGWARRYQGD
jgi:hypothetical protein